MSSNPTAVNPSENAQLTFPPDAMSGSLGAFAHLMAEGTEVPEEFYFAAGLTFLGASCGTGLKLDAALDVEPRLYTVLLGASADMKKSTALRATTKFFESVWQDRPAFSTGPSMSPSMCYGVGSAEGLARALNENRFGVVLCYDELKAFIDKSGIESSTLLPMVTSLFEQTKYENTTVKRTFRVEDARLSLIGCCTTDTYASMWNSDAISIGLPNRLFIVTADRKRRVSWPEPRDPAAVELIRCRIAQQLKRLPLTFAIAPDAKEAWTRWYDNLPTSVHVRRLESIGFRLLGLIALSNDKEQIDLATVNTVVQILRYEFAVRTLTDPIDADGTVARLEEAIRRQLGTRGSMSERDLRRFTQADRHGLWTFKSAIQNLLAVRDICLDTPSAKQSSAKYRLSSLSSSHPESAVKSSGLLELTPAIAV